MADKKFTLTFDVEGNLAPIKGAVKDFQSTIKSAKFQIPVGIQGNIDKTISKLNAEIAEFESLTSQGFSNMADIGKAEKSFAKITSLMRQLGSQGEQIKGLDPKKFLPKEILDRTAKLEKAFNKLGDIKINTKKIDAQTEAVKKQKEEVEELKTKYEALAAENKTAGARKGNLSSSIKSKEKELEAIQQQMKALEQVKGGKSSAEYSRLNAEFKTLSKTISAQKQEFASLDTSINKNKTTMSGLKVQLDSASSALDQMEESLKQLQASANVNEDLENLRKELAQLKNVNIDEIPDDLDEIKRIIGSLDDEHIKVIRDNLKDIGQAADNAVPSLDKAARKLQEAGEEGKEFTRVGQEIENLKGQVLDFFSITNTIQIFKNAVRDAFDTVKELDAVMTETAVVTDFSIGDMWDKLPEYSDQANKLGTSISSLYEATTLYYQQGLNSAQAMDVGIETMKMARIANMDAAAATEAMTAALRGFNMEINETSATRINDVYSELAAITASDTEQIATAMSKTASIASSANMEFETTAALLAQIIETTQEAPETAGTAMKTIIARFTEVKKLFSEGMLTGEDTEGESIDINKIDAALKTVGISLKDFLTGTKGIDDIFLELASKWDTLDLATQRYIATTAAGSRQQSRFLAMMGNYDRTMELVTAANNSAGASQKQFDKTTESLTAKLQRLKNAWDTFTMGLADNSMIKWGVDLLTELLDTINNLTEVGDGKLGNFITTVLRLGTVLIGLKAGQGALNGFLKFLEKSGATKIFGLNMGDIGKVDIFGTLFKSGKFAINDLEGLVAILKDPATRGEALLELGGAFKGLVGKIWGVVKAVGAFAKAWGGWIVLGIAVAQTIYTIIKAFNAAQDSAKMETLNNELATLSKEAENARSKLEQIGEDQNNLNQLENTLDNLTKGTNEWKQALIETNQEVLGLIEKYPDLIDYIQTGSNGQLTIAESGWDKIYKTQQQLILDLSNQKLATQAQIAELQTNIEFDSFIIDSQETKAAQKSTSFELKFANFLDSNLKLFDSEITWGDILANINDSLMIQSGLPTNFYKQLNEEVKAAGGYTKETERSKTGGLTEKEYTALAAALKEEGVTFTDGLTESERIKTYTVYQDLGLEASFMKTIITKAEALGQAFDELGNQALGLQIKEEQYARSFVGNATSGIANFNELDYADAINNLVTETKNYDTDLTSKINQQEEAIKQKYENDYNKIAEAYAEKFGKYYVDGKVYEDTSMEKELPVVKEGMIEALATADITVKIQEDAAKVAKGLKGKTDEQKELFDNLFSQEGSEIKARQIEKYQLADGTVDVAKIISDMGFTAENIETELGISVQEITDTLINNFESANDRIVKQRKQLVKNMTKYSSDSDVKDYEVNANLLRALELKYKDLDISSVLTDVINQLELTGDEEFSSAAYESLRDIMMKANGAAEMQDALDFFNTIDFRNPIDALDKINEEIKNGTGYSKEFAVSIKQVNSSFLGIQSQLFSLTNSADFENVKEDLLEIIDKNEEISASDVYDLTKSYKSLDKVLKNNEITAAGLAKVLEEIANGTLKVEDLTDTVLAALSSFEGLESIVAKTVKELEDFDLGIDENTVGETVGDWVEILEENIKKGAIGNSQNFRILDYLFPGWDEGLQGDQIIAEMKRLTQKLKGNGQNLRAMWSDLAAGKDYQGGKAFFDGVDLTENEKRKFDKLKVTDTGDEILFSGWEGKGLTSADLVTWISDSYKVSEELASMMLADFKNYSIDLADELRANDYTVGIEKAYEKLHQFGDIKLIDEQEIATISKLLGVDAGTIRSDLQERGARVTNFYEDGEIKDFEDIQKFMDTEVSGAEAGKKWTDSFIESVNKGSAQGDYLIDTLNLSDLERELGKIGITGANAEKLKQQAFESIREGLGQGAKAGIAQVEETLANGDKVTVTINPEMSWEEYQQQITKLTQKNEDESLAQAIVNAFQNVEIEPTISENTLITFRGKIEEAAQKANTEVDVSMSDTSAEEMGAEITEIAEQPQTTPISLNVTSQNISRYLYDRTVYINLKVKNNDITSAINNQGSTYNGIGSTATGIKNSPKTYESLVSEEGPELIQKAKGGAYLTGSTGPEIVEIEKGDTVYTAEETQDILKKRNHNVISRYASGYGNGTAYGGSGGTNASAKSDDDKEDWENPFDKLYNLVREIDEELRQRNRLERRYEKLLQSTDVTAGKLFENSVEQLKQLEKEKLLQKELQESRRQQITKYQQENSDLLKYAKIVQNERGEDVLRIHWDQINLIEDPEQGQRIEDYVGQLEEWMNGLDDIEDELNDIEDRIEEVKEQGKDEYLDLEEALKKAVEFQYQEQIDKLSQINDSINDTNDELINSIRNQINKIRQQRDNQKTEQELQDKQRQLLYLSQDTSGANDLAILELQREIEEGTQDYTDTLIDQKIDELEQQNQEAADQREKQIQILQAQLDQAIFTGAIWDEVYELMDEGLDPEIGLVRGSKLEQLLKESEGFLGMSKIQQMDWLKELQSQAAQAVNYMRLTTEKIDTAVTLNKQDYFGATTPEPSYSGSSGGSGGGSSGGGGGTSSSTTSSTTNSSAGSEVYSGPIWRVESTGGAFITNFPGTLEDAMAAFKNGYKIYSSSGVLVATNGQLPANSGSSSGGSPSSSNNSSTTNNTNTAENKTPKQVVITYVKDGNSKTVTYDYNSNWQSLRSYWETQWGPSTYYYKYKKGGLADFTGPAWLDGSKSRPELVLNARDTQNFIQLKDILASVMERGTVSKTSTENNGDITYDIDINVETIGNDYDVEQVANKVKSLINDNARYRNNNAVSLKR